MTAETKGPLDRTQVEDLFLEAIELGHTERAALLETRCGNNPALLAEVASLLASHDETGLVPEMDDPRPFGGRYPERIGEYRIVRPLGEGGMGVVLLAIREGTGFEQTVALKLIRSSFADPLLAGRLEEERRILALLEHPGIARLVDGGLTDDGHPYFAMEYVRGEDILSYCDTRQLPLEERLRLFAQVCDAVHHAHQQLVVHRDLKPSNILVTPEGLPKLLDFGVAKNLEAVSSAEHTVQWVTPAYASPEQVVGGVVSTLSDVYALGVLLCEILTGTRPYSTTNRAPGELARIVGEEPPRKPSDLVGPQRGEDEAPSRTPPEEAARRRRTTPQRLGRVLRGDLDQIVLKALAKEPHRRYDSARALAEDLRRYLAGRPVKAQPDSPGYRLGKFVARHRALVGVGGLLILALAGGAGGIVWQAGQTATERDRAEVEAVRARQVTALMTDIFRLGDPNQALGDTIGVRQVLEEGVRRVEETLSDDPVLQANLFLELARIYRNLGILGEAERLGSEVLALRRVNEAGSLAYADALGFQGLVLRDAGRSDSAMAHLEEAIELRDELVTTPDTATATLLAGLGWEVRSSGDHDRAGGLFRRALAIQQQVLGEDHPTVAATTLGLAATFHDQGSFDEAEDLFRSALKPGRAEASPVAATALVNLGMVQRLREKFAEAEPLLRSAVEMREKLYDPEHPDVLEARQQLAVCLGALGRFREAEAILEPDLAVAVRLFGEESDRTRSAREALGIINQDMGRYALAAARLDSSRVAKIRAHNGDHPGVVFSLAALGDVYLDAGRPAEAERRFVEALEMGARLGGNRGVYGAMARHGLARVALARDDVRRADSLSSEALAMAGETLREGHRYVLDMQRTRAQVLLEQGSLEEAGALLEAVVAAEGKVRPHPHPRTGTALLILGQVRQASGDADGARRAWRDAAAEFGGLPRTTPPADRPKRWRRAGRRGPDEAATGAYAAGAASCRR